MLFNITICERSEQKILQLRPELRHHFQDFVVKIIMAKETSWFFFRKMTLLNLNMGLDMEFLFLFLKRCSGGRKIISSGRKYILSGRHWAWAGAGGGALSENVGYICAALKSIISRLSAKASYSLGYHFTHESQDQSFLRVSFSGHIIFF